MKLVATILVAAFVVVVSMSMAFADCAGHTKAQLVKTDDQQVSSDRQANNDTLTAAPEKVVRQAKSEKVLEKR
jgi:hypothetical protein